MSILENANDHFEHGNYAAAMEGWRQAAEEGDTEAEFLLGQIHSRGEGIKKDFLAAHDHFMKAANRGHTEAEYSLGVLYGIGLGVEEDVPEAAYW
ncbi:MAG: sel1 repeat family protein, partial [Rhodospirillaceae bacterium]|nr:sel1 repeat family protein [Rhodospirillaceae bacterium]